MSLGPPLTASVASSHLDEDRFIGHGGRPGAGVLGTFLNTTKMSVGIGMLSFPYGFHRAGYGIGALALCIAGLLATTSVKMIVLTQRYAKTMLKAERVSYTDMVQELLGNGWKNVAAGCILIGQAGVSIGYEIFICNTFEAYFGVLSFNGWLLVLQPALLITCAFRSMRWLSIVSFLGVISLWVGLGLSSWLMAETASEKGWAAVSPIGDVGGYALFVGLSAFAFEGLSAVALTIENSMAEPERFMLVAVMSIVFLTAMECTFALLGIFSFGDRADQVITRSFSPGFWATAASIAFSLELLCTFPGNMYPVWKFWENVFFGPRPAELEGVPYPFSPRNSQIPRTVSRKLISRASAQTLFRSVGVLAMGVIAFLFRRDFALFLSLVGSFACSSVMYLIPARLQLQLVDRFSCAWFRAAAFFLLGIIVPIVGLISLVIS